MSKLKDITLEIDGQIVGLQQLIDHYTGVAFHPGAPASRAYAYYKRNEHGGEDFHAALWHPQTVPSKDERKVSGYFIPDRTDEPKNTIDKLVYDIGTRLTSVLTRNHLLLPSGSLEQIRAVIEKSVSHHALNVNLWKHEVQIAAMRLGIADVFNSSDPHSTLEHFVSTIETMIHGNDDEEPPTADYALTASGLCLILDDQPVGIGSILFNAQGTRLEVIAVNEKTDALTRELTLHHYPFTDDKAVHVGATLYEDLFYNGEQQLFWEAPDVLEVTDQPTPTPSLGLLSQYQDEGLIVVEIPLTGAANNGEWRSWLVTKGDGHGTRVYRWNNQIQIERDESDSRITITQHPDESKVGVIYTDSLLAWVMMEIEKDAKGAAATLSEVQDDPAEFNEEEDDLEVVDPPKEEDRPFPGDVFRHVDGGYYRFLLLTKSTEDQTIRVIYEHVWPFAAEVWDRPYEEWAKRFTKIHEGSLTQAMLEDREEFQRMVSFNKAQRRAREHEDTQNADSATEAPAYQVPEGWRSEDHGSYTAYRYSHKDGDIVLKRDHGDEDVDCMTHPVASMINWNYTNLEIAIRESVKYLPGWERAPFAYIGCTPILLTTPVYDAQGKRWMPVDVGHDRALNLIHTYGTVVERWTTTIFVDGKQVLFLERPMDLSPVEIPICEVEGRPVYNDSILYDAEGNEWTASRTIGGPEELLSLTRKNEFGMLVAWVTYAKVDGQPVLFWDKPEVEEEGGEDADSELEWQTGFRNGLLQVWFAETEDRGTIRVVPEAQHWVIQDMPGFPNHKQVGHLTYEKAIDAANRQWATFQQGHEHGEGVEDEPA